MLTAKGLDRFLVFARYLSVSASVYFFILIGMYLLVDVLRAGKVASYVFIYLLAYVAEYVMTLTLVFRSAHHVLKVVKFVVNTAAFLALGTLLFKVLIGAGVNYLVGTVGVAAILLPFRFVANKYFVYR